MNDGFHFLDIVFFAMVAAFLVLRLRSVLGRRSGNEPPPPKSPGTEGGGVVIDLAAVRRSAAEPPAGSPVAPGLAAIRAVDPSFDLDAFLAGARAAFEMIVAAFAAGDKPTLKPLLAPEVYRHFASAIDGRLNGGETLTTELVGIRKVEPVDARMDGPFAELTARFVSEQVNVRYDKDGHVIEGTPERVVDVIDEWSFRRDTRTGDPNWLLSATRTPEA